jgi:hypothetical protein
MAVVAMVEAHPLPGIKHQPRWRSDSVSASNIGQQAFGSTQRVGPWFVRGSGGLCEGWVTGVGACVFSVCGCWLAAVMPL